jgi:hypothetical protein
MNPGNMLLPSLFVVVLSYIRATAVPKETLEEIQRNKNKATKRS